MCDETTERELDAHLTRRGFGAGAIATMGVFATACATTAEQSDLVETTVAIPTPDGTVDGIFVYPAGGATAAVIMWPDIHGLRPAFFDMARRLAGDGYAVLAANPYYRTHEGRLFPEGMSIRDEGARELVGPHYSKLTSETVVTDSTALVAWLDEQAAVDKARGIGTVGFCMTGSWTIRAAATVPERVKAPCSFHSGRLVTDDADSPHLLAPKLTGGALIGIAENDHERNPAAKDALIKAFADAGVPAEIEVYADAMHGWVPTDSRAHNPEQAERAWGRMLALFERELG